MYFGTGAARVTDLEIRHFAPCLGWSLPSSWTLNADFIDFTYCRRLPIGVMSLVVLGDSIIEIKTQTVQISSSGKRPKM